MNEHHDPHMEWARQAADLEARLAAMPGETEADEAAQEPLWAELDRLRDKICTTPARTAAGARQQVLRAIRLHEQGSVLGEVELAGLRHAAATLERLADEVRASAMTGAASHHPDAELLAAWTIYREEERASEHEAALRVLTGHQATTLHGAEAQAAALALMVGADDPDPDSAQRLAALLRDGLPRISATERSFLSEQQHKLAQAEATVAEAIQALERLAAAGGERA
jgi:hypothetical protein